jgi:hypothetical protein
VTTVYLAPRYATVSSSRNWSRSRRLRRTARTAARRPLTPLHGGHVALCAVSGMLNGVFGSGKDRHVAAWQAVKVVDKSEETEEDGTIVVRGRERFTNELTLVFASGETAILR